VRRFESKACEPPMIIVRYVLLAVLILGSSLHAGEVDVKRLHKAKWTRLDTENFSVITDAGEKKGFAMAEDLEHFFYFASRGLGFEQRPLADRVTVILAKRTSTFTGMGVPDEYGGVFLSRPDLREFVLVANASRFSASAEGGSSSGRSIVLHELMHLIIRNGTIGIANPPWYNEGIADYFGTYIRKKDEIILGDLSLLQYRFYSILTPSGSRFESIQSESLFKTAQEELPIVEDASRKQNRTVSKFYARSAAVVHYMNADPERRRQLYTYLYLIKNGRGIDESFDYAFKMTFEELDQRVHDHLNSRFVMARTFNVGKGGVEFPDVTYEAKSLDAREALRILITRIRLFSDSFLGEGNREKMNADVEEFYPDLF
jgi:hypothetical protein